MWIRLPEDQASVDHLFPYETDVKEFRRPLDKSFVLQEIFVDW